MPTAFEINKQIEVGPEEAWASRLTGLLANPGG
jgi:hypothetical protein